MKFICTFCETFTFDEKKGDLRAELPPRIRIEQIPEQWRCPVCGHWKGNLKEISRKILVFNKRSENKHDSSV